jgi:hypothetical protein
MSGFRLFTTVAERVRCVLQICCPLVREEDRMVELGRMLGSAPTVGMIKGDLVA